MIDAMAMIDYAQRNPVDDTKNAATIDITPYQANDKRGLRVTYLCRPDGRRQLSLARMLRKVSINDEELYRGAFSVPNDAVVTHLTADVPEQGRRYIARFTWAGDAPAANTSPLGLPARGSQLLLANEPAEARLMSIMSHEPRHMDTIAEMLGMPIWEVSAAAMILRLNGRLDECGPGLYRRKL